MLYDVSFTEHIIDSKDIEKTPYLQHLYTYYSGDKVKIFNKMILSVDSIISLLKPSRSLRLVWTKRGVKTSLAQYIAEWELSNLWDNITESYMAVNTSTKSQNNQGTLEERVDRAVDTFIMWRISLRNDHVWLMYKRDTKQISSKGTPIRITEYWIDDSFGMSKFYNLTDPK